jgi:spermidine/putrescine transport system substrate-binding protein
VGQGQGHHYQGQAVLGCVQYPELHQGTDAGQHLGGTRLLQRHVPGQPDAKAAKRPFGIGYTLQKEGNTLSLDSMMIMRSAQRPDLAHRFINFMLEGRNSSELTNMLGSGNPNRAAAPFVRTEIKKIPAIFPSPAARQKLVQLAPLEGRELRELNRLWTQVKTATR